MAKFYVEMLIEFSGEIEADSEEQAEELAWTAWGDTMDSDLTFDNVLSIDVKEVEEEDEEDE